MTTTPGRPVTGGRRPMSRLVRKRPAATITASRRICALMAARILLPKSYTAMRLGSRWRRRVGRWEPSTGWPDSAGGLFVVKAKSRSALQSACKAGVRRYEAPCRKEKIAVTQLKCGPVLIVAFIVAPGRLRRHCFFFLGHPYPGRGPYRDRSRPRERGVRRSCRSAWAGIGLSTNGRQVIAYLCDGDAQHAEPGGVVQRTGDQHRHQHHQRPRSAPGRRP